MEEISKNDSKKLKFSLFFGIIAFFILIFLSVFAGTKALPFGEGIKSFFKIFTKNEISNGVKTILLKIRIPRTFSVIFCGSALSVSGLLLQTSLNNNLASPGIIGINSGSGFFLLLSSLLFPYSMLARTFGSFLGAMLSIFVVYLISKKAGISKTTLILAGIAVSSLMSAGIDVIITVYPEIVADKVAFNLGGFQNFDISSVKFIFPIILVGIFVAFLISNGIDLFALGDETAFSLGVNVKFLRILSIIISGILASAAVSICGLLSFVGLIIPNIIRLFGRYKTRTNIILCIIFGSDFLLFCDFLARVLFFPYELPVGLFLSCLGSPFFVFMLIRRKKRYL